MNPDPRTVAGFSYRSASVEIAAADPALLDGIRFLYRAFETPVARPAWRYDVAVVGGRVHVRLGEEIVHAAEDEIDALNTLDWCVASHLLADPVPAPVVLHAAALSLPGGGTLVLAAPSGGGKSTLAAALLGRGATLLSDEFVPIDPADGRPLAYPRAVGLKNGLALPAEAVRDEHVTRSPRGTVRWIQPVRTLGAGRSAEPIAAVVFCEYDPAATTRLSPVPYRVSLARLLGQAPMLAEDRATGFPTLAAVAEQAPSYELVHADAAAAADGLLSLPRTIHARQAS